MELEMNTLTSRLIGTGALFLFVFLSGVWLSNLGKPINVSVMTIHKLIALGTLIFIGATIYQVNQVTPLTTTAIAATVITGIFFVATIIAGGLLSLDKPVAAMSIVHRVGPFLTVASTIVTMYLVVNHPQ
jgi:hypothetical protein